MSSIVFQVLGGLGLFLFGMKVMSEGLQKFAGKRLRHILWMVSRNRFIGCAVGTFVTSVIQSSSATTVMLVSFVDAGIMTLTQATGMILGANIGTTVTAQLIAFKIEAYALPAIATGVFLKFLFRRRNWIYAGDVLLGFGLVFYGLATMKSGVAPLKEDPSFISVFTKFRADTIRGILLCMLTGTVLTMILQSSSATVGITMALACQGLLHFDSSAALILGTEIGTTVTAQIAALGANINAHRTATAHSFINVFGVFIVILFFPLFIKLVVWMTSILMGMGPPDFVIGGQKPNIARHIANFQTIFNLITALFFLMILPYVVKAAIWFTPQGKEDDELDELHHVKYLDSRYIDTPSMALTQARAEIIRMGEAVQVMYDDVISSLPVKRQNELSKYRKREDALDLLQREITHFLVRTTQGNISEEDSREVRSLIRMTNNLERIGDATEDIAESHESLVDQNLSLSKEALKDYKEISSEVRKFLTRVINAVKYEDEVKEIMQKCWEIRNEINIMVDEMREAHLLRLQKGVCTVESGVIFVEILTAFEKMGGFCFNIAEAVAGLK